VAGVFAAVSVLFAGAAAAQTVNCPAGARGGAGGNAGTSNGGTGGLALNVPVFSSGVGGSTAGGGNGGSARGGTGGRGGSGTLPVCNQNTNGGAVAAAPVARGATAAPAARGATYGAGGPVARSSGGRGYGVGGPVGLASTGARTDTELIVAGLAFVVGGALLMLSQPLRRRVRA
jgi:hypothetical protein